VNYVDPTGHAGKFVHDISSGDPPIPEQDPDTSTEPIVSNFERAQKLARKVLRESKDRMVDWEHLTDLSGCKAEPNPAPGCPKVLMGYGPFIHGQLFETWFVAANGLKVGALAETQVAKGTLTLKNVTIYAEGSNAANVVGARDFVSLLKQITEAAKAQGFKKLVIEGIRVTNSTSANPGKIIQRIIDLTK